MPVTARALAPLAAVALVACGKAKPYACNADSQCVQGGVQGVCGPAGFCAFPDSCGYKYEPNAGGGVAGTCFGPDAGAAACGEIGQACCAQDTCNDGTCNAGTCTSCVAQLAFGRRFGCVLKTDHTVWCSGDDASGQLGIGLPGVPTATRMQVLDSSGTAITDATAIGAGRDFACAVRAGGTAWCWGSGYAATATQVTEGDGSPLTGAVSVEVGYSHACALDGSGGVWCWGSNSAGELGDGTTTSRGAAAPVLTAAGGAALTGATALVVGARTSCVRMADGTAWCWGYNNDGELGNGSTTASPVPIKLATTSSLSTWWRTCYVQADSTIMCTGWDGHAGLGIGSGEGYTDNGPHTIPVQVLGGPGSAFTGAAQVAGSSSTCAIDTGGAVWCWGDDLYGQNGLGATALYPTKVPGLAGVDRMVVHFAHTCAHEASGAWLCWGRNREGELGDGTFVDVGAPAPLQVSCP